MPKGKYHKQLWHVFTAIGIFFALFVIVSFTYLLISSVKHKFENSVRQTVASTQTLSELSISSINSVLNSMVQDPDIRLWGKTSVRSDFYFNATLVKKRLGQLTSQLSALPFYPAVTKLDPDVFVLSSFGSSSKEEYFETETTLSPSQSRQILSYYETNSGELVVPTYDKEEQLTDLYYFMKRTYDTSDLLYMIRIPKTSLFHSDDNQRFILYNEESILAFSHNNQNTLNAIYQESCQPIFHTYSNHPAEPVKSGRRSIYILSFSKSNWKIAYLYDDIGLTGKQIILFILMPFFCICILFFLISKKLSNWLYAPIREIVSEVSSQALPDSQAPFELDEFELMRQNAGAAKRLADELKSVMNENDSLILQRFNRDLIWGLDVKNNKLYQGFILKGKSYLVALAELEDIEGEALEHDIFFCKNTILSMAQEAPRLQAVNINYNTCAIVIESDSLEEGKHFLHTILDCLPPEQKLKAALSNPRPGMESIHTSFLEASKILEYKYLFSSSEILTAKEAFAGESIHYYYPILAENKLIQALAEGKESALTQFDDLIRENFMRRDLTPETLRSFIYTLLSTLNRIFQELKTTPEALLSHSIPFEALYANWNDPNIITKIRSYLCEILYEVRNRNANADSKIRNEMLSYIYTHYSSDIMLDDMAAELGITAKYCSNLFKKVSDDTFKNFLNKYRIERAKEIIEEKPDIRLTELCTMVGFNSSNTLIRVFGKYTGMTPKSYVNQVKEKSV